MLAGTHFVLRSSPLECYKLSMSDPFDLAEAVPAEPPYLAALNPSQRAAVEATEGPVLVLAGAGTGKTRVLTSRIAHLLMTGRAYPGQVLAVTFTNKAAREMVGRVERLIGRDTAGLWFGTFHSIAARILRRHAELVGLKSDFTIIDTDDQLRLLRQVLSAHDIDDKRWPARALLTVIERWKDRGLTPDRAGHDDGHPRIVARPTAVLADGLAAVETACAEALAGGACSADVVLNILNRRRQPSETAPIPTPASLSLRFEPAADCRRPSSASRGIVRPRLRTWLALPLLARPRLDLRRPRLEAELENLPAVARVAQRDDAIARTAELDRRADSDIRAPRDRRLEDVAAPDEAVRGHATNPDRRSLPGHQTALVSLSAAMVTFVTAS